MRRFLITVENNPGNIELIYNDKEELCCIDYRNISMKPFAVASSMEKFAKNVMLADLFNYFKTVKTASLIEADFEITFDMFWKKYNRKFNRKRAEATWDKLSKTDQVKAYYGIDAYDKFLKKESWRSKADPDTYLKNRYWENEYSNTA